MLNVFFWRGAIAVDNRSIFDPQPVLKKLLTRDYQPNDLEKLRGHRDIYSYRINDTERLLFTTWKKNDQPYLLFLEHLPTHDYQKSRFLRSGVLRNYLIRHDADFLASSSSALFETAPEDPFKEYLTPEIIDDIDIQPMDYHHEFIHLNTEQDGALHVSLPALITGAAGSGKSCISMLLFGDRIQQFYDDARDIEQLRLLYVTQSENLINQMRFIWNDQPVRQDLDSERVHIDFCTPQTLISMYMNLEGNRFTTDADREHWYSQKCSSLKKIKQSPQKEVLTLLPTADALLQEFRICSGYETEEYLKLGVRQSSVARNVRQTVIELYTEYLRYLQDGHLIDADFTDASRPEGEKYHLVVVDEAQNFSHLQLKQCAKFATNHSIVYCMDPHQYLKDKISKRSFIMDELFRHLNPRQSIQAIQLNVGYRSPIAICDTANKILELKHRVQGGILDQSTSLQLSTSVEDSNTSGYVFIMNEAAATPSWVLDHAKGTQLVVITSEEVISTVGARQEIERLFGTPHIMTIAQCQGQQYTTVIAYKLFVEKDMLALKDYINASLSSSSSGSATYHRPKAGLGSNKSTLFLNGLYTAFTRARQNLIIYETNAKCNKPFFDLISPIVTNNKVVPRTDITSSEEDWIYASRVQLQQGNLELARRICLTKTNYNWLALLNEHTHNCEQAGVSIDESIRTVLTDNLSASSLRKTDAPSVRPVILSSSSAVKTDARFFKPVSLSATDAKAAVSSTVTQQSSPLDHLFDAPFTRKKLEDYICNLEGSPYDYASWMFSSLANGEKVVEKIAKSAEIRDIFLNVLLGKWKSLNKRSDMVCLDNAPRFEWVRSRQISLMLGDNFDLMAIFYKQTEAPKTILNSISEINRLNLKPWARFFISFATVMIYSMRCETDPIRRPIDIDAIRRPIDLDEILLRENYLYWAAAYNPTFLFEIFNKKLCKSLIHQWQYTPLGEGEQKNIIQILGSHEDGKELLKKIISNEGEYQPLLRKQDALKACIQTSIAYEIVNDWSNGSSLYKQKNPDPTDNNEVDPHLGMGV